jgi:hypothetical protein
VNPGRSAKHGHRLGVFDHVDRDGPAARRVQAVAELLELAVHALEQVFDLPERIASCHTGQDSARTDFN